MLGAGQARRRNEMTTRTQLLEKRTAGGPRFVGASVRDFVHVEKLFLEKAGEVFWGISTFALFLLLGPFSAIAAVFGLANLARQNAGNEPESLV